MPLRIEISWDNAPHLLLPEPGAPGAQAGPEPVQLRLGGSPVAPASRSFGRRTYEITDTSGTVELRARFTVTLGAVSGVSAEFTGFTVSTTGETHDVLDIAQSFEIVEGGARLRPLPQVRYDHRPHPLVDKKALKASNRGVAPIHLFTDFVDITPFWKAYAAGYDYYEVQGGGQDTELVALGRTNGKPLIWFAHVPAACAGSGAAYLGCLLFYRPGLAYTYTRIDQLHEMFPLARYLLTPNPASTRYFERDYIATYDEAIATAPPALQARADNLAYLIRCGVEDALHRSNKRVVMLQPWPQKASFGAGERSAFGPRLWSRCAVPALRLLFATGHTKRPRSAYFGLSGFSHGGGALWAALGNNLAKVAEVYGFEAHGTEAKQGIIQQWHKLGGNPLRRHLRLVGSVEKWDGSRWAGSLVTHRAIRDALLLHYGKPTLASISALPETIDSFDLDPTICDNPYWLHAVKERAPGGQFDPVGFRPDLARHQFCMFGGYPTDKRPATRTFLQRCLEESDFPG